MRRAVYVTADLSAVELPEIVPNWMLSVPEPVVALEEEKAGEASTCAEARWLTSSE